MSASATKLREERLQRLKNLHLQINEARKANHVQVVEEDRRKRLPSNWESKQSRMRWEEEEDQFKADCALKGVDPDRTKALNVSAELVNRLEARKRRRKPQTGEPDNEDPDVAGFTTYADVTHRKYLKQAKALKPNMAAYEKQKEKLGDLAYPSAHTIGLVGNEKDSREAIEHMSNTLKDQASKKSAYSRRRAFDPDADIDYINERNKRFNELLDRHYGKYTAEIKQNLERGTAL